MWRGESSIESLEGRSGFSWQHVFSPDGRTLYTSGEGGGVIMWDVTGDRRLGTPFRTNTRNDLPRGLPAHLRPQPRWAYAGDCWV